MRPCAHFTRLPFSTLAEDRTIELDQVCGTRTTQILAGMTESWWAMARMRWIAIWNGLKAGRDRLTPYLRRHHAKGFLQMLPVRCACDGEISTSLWSCQLVDGKVGAEVRCKCACRHRFWACWSLECERESYGVFLVTRFTWKGGSVTTAKKDARATVVSPECVTFPLKERLSPWCQQ